MRATTNRHLARTYRFPSYRILSFPYYLRKSAYLDFIPFRGLLRLELGFTGLYRTMHG